MGVEMIDNLVQSLPPGAFAFGAIAIIGAIIIAGLASPRWGCGGFIGLVALGMILTTVNGTIAIVMVAGGAVVIGIVWIMSQRTGTQINIENSNGNNIYIGGGRYE